LVVQSKCSHSGSSWYRSRSHLNPHPTPPTQLPCSRQMMEWLLFDMRVRVRAWGSLSPPPRCGLVCAGWEGKGRVVQRSDSGLDAHARMVQLRTEIISEFAHQQHEAVKGIRLRVRLRPQRERFRARERARCLAAAGSIPKRGRQRCKVASRSVKGLARATEKGPCTMDKSQTCAAYVYM
jgi:hypothetical protein